MSLEPAGGSARLLDEDHGTDSPAAAAPTVETRYLSEALSSLREGLDTREAFARAITARLGPSDLERAVAAAARSLLSPDFGPAPAPAELRARARQAVAPWRCDLDQLNAVLAGSAAHPTPPGARGGLSSQDQERRIAQVRELNTAFQQEREASDRERYGASAPAMHKEREGRLRALETCFRRRGSLRMRLDEVTSQYTEMTHRIEKLLCEAKDHACAQQVMRGDTTTQEKQEQDDAALAQQLHAQMVLEAQQQQAAAAAPAPAPSPGVPGAPGATGGMRAMSTKIPPGVLPGSKLRVTLPNSTQTIDLDIPAGMGPGDTLQFLVPTAVPTPAPPPPSRPSLFNPASLFSSTAPTPTNTEAASAASGGPGPSSSGAYRPPPAPGGDALQAPLVDPTEPTTLPANPTVEASAVPNSPVLNTVDDATVHQLMEMGFSEDSVRAALVANHGDMAAALNALLTADETEALRVSMG